MIGGVTVGDMVRLLGEGKRVEDMENNRGMQVLYAAPTGASQARAPPQCHACIVTRHEPVATLAQRLRKFSLGSLREAVAALQLEFRNQVGRRVRPLSGLPSWELTGWTRFFPDQAR